MAESYRTEEEQIDALKRWWKDNGQTTVISIVVAVAAVFGWQGWQNQQQTKMAASSSLYEDMLSAANAASGFAASTEQITTAKHLANTLKKDYAGSAYAGFAGLYLAKFAVEVGDLDGAVAELRVVIDAAVTPELLAEATLRLARVLQAQGNYVEALAALTDESAVYAASYEEVRGDIHLAQGNHEAAAMSYQKSVELTQESGAPATSPLLTMKIQHLASLMGDESSAVEANTNVDTAEQNTVAAETAAAGEQSTGEQVSGEAAIDGPDTEQ